MTPVASSPGRPLPYVPDLFRPRRRKTREVKVGSVGMGGDNPIRIQSMTTTPTSDVEATVAQTISLVQAGCEIVRITAPTPADARALGRIKKALLARGLSVPLVADIHFNPDCAMEAAEHVEKVRINPGNYADSKAFKIKEYSDAQYAAELSRLEERFTPLVLKLKVLKRALRIGANHGSLSDRILNRYGDSPEGMVESAMEFVRICRRHDFNDIVLSMKSSNVKVMIAAYRLLVRRLDDEGLDYPFHLGVTEAGYGQDGRVKSAIGIGSLLNDGIGDTIRVSLTEDPEKEIPVAFALAAPYQPGGIQDPEDGPIDLSPVDDFYHYARRPSRGVSVGPFTLGGGQPVRVTGDYAPWIQKAGSPAISAKQLAALIDVQRRTGQEMLPEILEWSVNTPADLDALRAFKKTLGPAASSLAFLGRFIDLAVIHEGIRDVDLAVFTASRELAGPHRLDQFRQFVRAAKAAGRPVLLESGPCHRGALEPARNLLKGIELCESEGHAELVISFRLPDVRALVSNARLGVAHLREKGKAYPLHLRLPGGADFETDRLAASVAFGSLLCDGLGDSVQAGAGKDPAKELELLYGILQGAGVRVTRAEYVSCPSCGRTLFDLQTATERIKQKTGHLKGVKIAIMGCIVNGPGEMADADFGYVGGAPGKINLYVGKTCVEKGIPSADADDRLVALIKMQGKWADPK